MSTTTLEASSIAVSVGMATAAGLVGCFALMRRMTLAADALSHVALPGIGLALALHIHPLAGALAALFLGTLLVWALEGRTPIATEVIVGVVFSAALAVGSMMTAGDDLIDALLGQPGTLGAWEIALGLAGAGAVVAFIFAAKDRLVITLVSPEIAHTAGINVRKLHLFYLLAFALTVALGLRHLGVLLMGSLIIIPAATARRMAGGLNAMLAVAVVVAVLSTLLGTWAAALAHSETGPLIVLVAATCFLASLLFVRQAS